MKFVNGINALKTKMYVQHGDTDTSKEQHESIIDNMKLIITENTKYKILCLNKEKSK